MYSKISQKENSIKSSLSISNVYNIYVCTTRIANLRHNIIEKVKNVQTDIIVIITRRYQNIIITNGFCPFRIIIITKAQHCPVYALPCFGDILNFSDDRVMRTRPINYTRTVPRTVNIIYLPCNQLMYE